MRARFWIAIGAIALTALVATGAITIGVPGQWAYGLHSKTAPPSVRGLQAPLVTALPAVFAAALLGGILWFGIPRLDAASRLGRCGWVAALVAAGGLQLFTLIFASRAGLREPSLVHYVDWSGGFFGDALRLRDEPLPAAHYDRYYDRLSVHGRSHPPGPMMINRWARSWFSSHRELGARIDAFVGMELKLHPAEPWEVAACHVVAWLILAVGVTAAVPVYLLGADLYGRPAGFAAAGLYLCVPALAFFEPMMDLVNPVFSIWALWFLHRGPKWWVASGAMIGLGLFFSYCHLAVLPVLGICWLGKRQWKPLTAFPAGVALAGLVLWLACGFNLAHDLYVFLARIGTHTYDVPSWMGLPAGSYERPYLTWIFMNLVEFFSFVGFPLAAGLVWAAARLRPKSMDMTTAAVAGGILLLDLLALNRSEVARIWMFLMPAVAVVAAGALVRTPRAAVAFAAITWMQAFVFKLALTTNNIVN